MYLTISVIGNDVALAFLDHSDTSQCTTKPLSYLFIVPVLGVDTLFTKISTTAGEGITFYHSFTEPFEFHHIRSQYSLFVSTYSIEVLLHQEESILNSPIRQYLCSLDSNITYRIHYYSHVPVSRF